jgi:hypothetical protein
MWLGVKCVQVAQYRDRLRDILNTVMNLFIQEYIGNFSTSSMTIIFGMTLSRSVSTSEFVFLLGFKVISCWCAYFLRSLRLHSTLRKKSTLKFVFRSMLDLIVCNAS